IHNEEDLINALVQQPVPLLMQALARGEQEFGLMFARDVATGRTELLSVTGKRFLSVVGDGQRTVEQLLSLTWRGQKQIERLRSVKGEELLRVPTQGERVVVEPIGNHCRGTIFFDACDLATPALRDAVDALFKDVHGINYGRLDVRAESEQALREGRFMIVELNGVSSEPGHIYDPSYSIFRCWIELVRHVRHVGRISLHEQRRSHQPTTLGELITRCERYFGWRLGPVRRLAAAFA
ncbi:MAG TPA: hypothetical protein PK760_06810, partial [Flavobacteriales bacterium]|nr:hypothetical protein [Flavobacteriales bacterium]